MAKQKPLSKPTVGSGITQTHLGYLLCLLPFVITVLLQGIGGLLPGYFTWGVDVWSIFPSWLIVILLLVYGALSIPVATQFFALKARNVVDAMKSSLSKLPVILSMSAISVGLFILFMTFRSHALIYGDGYLVLDRSTAGLLDPFADLHEYTKPLTIFLYRAGHVIIGQWLGQPKIAFAVVTSVGGVAGFWGASILCSLLKKERLQRISLMALMVSSTCSVLFFGYVEQYSLGTAALLWWMAALIAYYRGVTSGIVLGVATIITIGLNVLLLPLAMIFLIKKPRRVGTNDNSLRLLFDMPGNILPLLAFVGSIAVAAIVQAGHLKIAIVPLYPSSESPYWALSKSHLLDMANLLLHVAPIGLLTLVMTPVLHYRHTTESRILLYVGLLLAFTSFWIDPVFGAARDWDLLSSCGFPLSLAGALLLLGYGERCGRLQVVLTQTLLMPIFLLVPNVLEKNHLQWSVGRLDRILWDAPQYQTSYRNGHDLAQWSTILSNEVKRSDLGQKYLERRLGRVSDDSMALYNLAQIAFERGQFLEAVNLYSKALKLVPTNQQYRLGLAFSLQASGRHSEARELVSDIRPPQVTSSEVARSIGVLFAQEGLTEESIPFFRKAIEMDRGECDDFINMGLAYSALNKADSAVFYLERALKGCSEERSCDILQSLVIEHIKSRDRVAAKESLNEYATMCPGATDIALLRNRISKIP